MPEFPSDPMISRSGKIYSTAGLKTLAAVLTRKNPKPNGKTATRCKSKKSTRAR